MTAKLTLLKLTVES